MAPPAKTFAVAAVFVTALSKYGGDCTTVVSSGDGTVGLTFDGSNLVSVTARNETFALNGAATGTKLVLSDSAECQATVVTASSSNFTLSTSCTDNNNTVQIVEEYIPTLTSVHCQVTVGNFQDHTHANRIWTAPISTTLTFEHASELQLWAPWDRESQQHGQDNWVDPLLPSDGKLGWWTGTYWYGKTGGPDYIVAPMVSVLDSQSDTGLTVLLDPTDEQLELSVRGRDLV